MKILGIAAKEIGTKEAATNRIKYNQWYYGSNVSGANYDYCGVFLLWCFEQAGLLGILWGTKEAARKAVAEGVKNWMALGQTKGRWHTKDYKPGDIVLFDFNKNSVPDHIGIVESVKGSNLITIEGNTRGPNGEPEGVWRRSRANDSTVLGVFRPDYPDSDSDNQTKPPTPPAPPPVTPPPLPSKPLPPAASNFKKGDMVRIRQGAIDIVKKKKYLAFVYRKTYILMENPAADGSVAFSPNGKTPATGRVKIDDLTKAHVQSSNKQF